MADPQAQILESAKASGLIAPDILDGLVREKRPRMEAAGSPLLKAAIDRTGLQKQDLDRLLERFWAQAGARRALLHRSVEERLVAAYIVDAGLAPEPKVDVAERELEERAAGGDPVRLLSILVDSGTLDENAARQTVTEVQRAFRFCKHCLSSWKDGNGEGGGGGSASGTAEGCAVCGRPLSVAARAYEIVKLSTIAEDSPGSGKPSQAAGPAAKVVKLPEAGDTIAGVKLLEKVDEQGRGVVYKGERADDKQPRAVKVWRVGKDLSVDDAARFETAAMAAVKLEHPSILKVFEAGEDRGHHFVVTEWVGGKALRDIVQKKGPLPPEKAVPLMKKALEALDAAHKQKLLHKNVTPGNLFVLDDGGVKLADFGVCKDYGVSLETVRGNVIGSPDYLAPEQCQGLKSDERTDLFSLGATFYFALSGKKPFEGDSTVTLVVKRLTTDPVPLPSVAPKVSKDLADIITKMMARKPDERFASAKEALTTLERWEAKVEAGVASQDPTGKGKKFFMLAAAGAAMVVVAAAVIWALLSFSGPSRAFLAEVEAGRQMGQKGLLVEAAEKLHPLAKQESGKGPASGALEEVLAKVISRAKELSGQKDFPQAVSLVKKARPSFVGVGLPSEGAFTELEASLERAREAYEREATQAYEQARDVAERLGPEDALKRWQAYLKDYPHQPLEERARLSAEKLEAKLGQVRLLDEAERLANAGDPEGARQKLADAVAAAPLPENLEARKRKIERLIDFMTHQKEGERLLAAGELEAAEREFDRAAEVLPDRPEVRRWKARARYEGIMKRAREAEAKDDLVDAVAQLKKAEAIAAEAGLDLEPIREKRKALEASLRARKESEQRGATLIAEAEKALTAGDYRTALRRFREAEKLIGSTPQIQDGIARAEANLGAADEEAAWKEAQTRVAKSPQPRDKLRHLNDYLGLYPQGANARNAREAIERIRSENGIPETGGSATATAPSRMQPLRPGDRAGESVNPGDGSVMVKVPRGKFKRGLTTAQATRFQETWGLVATETRDEVPQSEVDLDEFFIDVYEVTNADYAMFLAALAGDKALEGRVAHPQQPPGKSHEPKYWASDDRWTRPELPVVGVDWFDAYSYAQWAGKRLPTEAEWEKAARGPDGRVYPWGDQESPFIANTAELWLGRAVASKAEWKRDFYDRKLWSIDPWKADSLTVAGASMSGDRSPYGVQHLGGNVWEWCEDWYHQDAYAQASLGGRNPVASKQGPLPHKVVRGGAWFDPLYYARTTARGHHLAPDQRNFTTGFRCARSAEGAGTR